jgi:hypothetical protein
MVKALAGESKTGGHVLRLQVREFPKDLFG